jgi:hypothetical protein
MTGRVLYAALDLLDRQLRDRHGVLCGNVDDLELERTADSGELYVTALVSGPGTLLERLGHLRLGRWLQRTNRTTNPAGDERVPMGLVQRIGPVVDLALDASELATYGSERWVRDHVISHVPGSRYRAPE